MNLLHQQQQQYSLFFLVFIFVTQTISVPVKDNTPHIRCNLLHQNCTIILRNSSSNSRDPGVRTSLWSSLSTSRLRSTTKSSSISDFDAFSDNLKRAALILAGIALGLGILRICLMLCKSRSPRTPLSNRHSSTVRPQLSTIEHHQFKPDLPPEYAVAIANMENDGGKLPSYEELPYEQRQQQYVCTNNGYITTQM